MRTNLNEEIKRQLSLMIYKKGQVISEQDFWDQAKSYGSTAVDVAKSGYEKTKEVSKDIINKSVDVAKDVKYNYDPTTKSCDDSKYSNMSYSDAFESAKKAGCLNFKYKGEWKSTKVKDMTPDAEMKAYGFCSKGKKVVVDYFLMGQPVIANGAGHIQTWSYDEPEYQINAMPNNKSGDNTFSITKQALQSFSKQTGVDSSNVKLPLAGNVGNTTDQYTMYNQKVEELDGSKRESIVICLTDVQYSRYKEVTGKWPGKLKNGWSKMGKINNKYDVLFNNCSDETFKVISYAKDASVKPSEAGWSLESLKLPFAAFQQIKTMFKGDYTPFSSGIKFKKIT